MEDRMSTTDFQKRPMRDICIECDNRLDECTCGGVQCPVCVEPLEDCICGHDNSCQFDDYSEDSFGEDDD